MGAASCGSGFSRDDFERGRSRLKALLPLALAFESLGSAVAGSRFDQLGLCVGQIIFMGCAFNGFLSCTTCIVCSLFIQLIGAQRSIRKNRNQVRLYLEQATRDIEEALVLALQLYTHLTRTQVHHHRRVTWCNAHLTVLARCNDQIAFTSPDLALGADDVNFDCAHDLTAVRRSGFSRDPAPLPKKSRLKPLLLLQGLGLFDGIVDGANHIESLLGQMIILACHDALEAADGLLQGYVLAILAGELRSHEEGL